MSADDDDCGSRDDSDCCQLKTCSSNKTKLKSNEIIKPKQAKKMIINNENGWDRQVCSSVKNRTKGSCSVAQNQEAL